MLPTPYRTVVRTTLIMAALSVIGCRNQYTDDTTPPDPAVVPQAPQESMPLHMEEDDDYEEYQAPEDYMDDERQVSPPAQPPLEERMSPGDDPDDPAGPDDGMTPPEKKKARG